MSSPPLLALRDAHVSFGGRPLFTGVSMQVGRGEKCCLVGRNGSGKSTLLKVLAGELQLDEGEHFRQPGSKLALLAQDPRLDGATIAIGWTVCWILFRSTARSVPNICRAARRAARHWPARWWASRTSC